MKAVGIFFAVFLFSFLLKAGDNPDFAIKYWQSGEALLNSGEKVKGKIYLEIEKELLLIFNKGKIKTYSSSQVFSFSLLDDNSGSARLFYSIPVSINGAVTRSYFFEIMTEGRLVFLRKQRSRPDGYGNFFFYDNPGTGCSGFYDYYFLEDAELIKVRNFRRDAMERMASHSDQIYIFIEKNGLNLRKLSDQLRILRYYNSLYDDGLSNMVTVGNVE